MQASSQLSTKQMLKTADEHLMFVVKRPPQVMVRGEGNYMWDAAGNRYLDFIQGWAVNCLGHSPAVLLQALQQQAEQLVNGSPALLNAPMIELAELLCTHSVLDKVFFASSGAEANEGAIKLARRWAQKKTGSADAPYEIITAWNSFHGRTLATMSATGKAAWEPLFEPKVPGFKHVDFNDLAALKSAITPQTCAIMLEPVQGEGGVFIPDQAYFKGVRELCDQHGLLLILDEVQTGIGRTGKLFGYENFGIEPDIMTLGKGLGGGFPVSALLAKDHCCAFVAGDQGGTYCGQPLAMRAALAVVTEVIEKQIPRHATQMGAVLVEKLQGLSKRFNVTEVRGMGLMAAIDFAEPIGAKVVDYTFQSGLLINAPRPQTLRFMPALTVTEAEINDMMSILEVAIAKSLDEG